jgi:hypothetical protein
MRRDGDANHVRLQHLDQKHDMGKNCESMGSITR